MAVYMYGQSVESRASSCVQIVLLRASVRVPLIDTLDSSPQVSVRALVLEWRLYSRVEFPWGRASDPTGVAPEPLKEFLTPSRVILPILQKRYRHQWWQVPIGSFCMEVLTYSR